MKRATSTDAMVADRCHERNRLLASAPPSKRQRLSKPPAVPRPAQDASNERLVHLNMLAIQCLQNGECEKAQCILLNALDLVKARQMGAANQQISSIGDCGGSTDEDAALSCVDEQSYDIQATRATQPSPTTGYDEGFRANMEPLHFSTADHPPSHQAAIIYYNVGISFLCFQKPKEARSWFNLALICFDDNSYPADPNVLARIHSNIGFCLKDDSPEGAMKAYHLSLMLTYRSPELLNSSFPAFLFNALGVLLYRMSHHESAMVYLQESLSQFKTMDGMERELASVMHNIGRVLFAQHEFEAALEEFERALTARRRDKRTSSVELAASLCSVGSTLEKLHREEEAVEFYAELVELECLKGNEVDFTLVCSALAGIYKRHGKLDDARPLYEKAVRVGRDCFGETHPLIARCLKALADCYLKNGDATKAVDNYEAALKLERLASKETHAETVKVLLSLASLYDRVGQYTAAIEKYAMVYELQKKMFGASSGAAHKARTMMAEMEYKLRNYDQAFEIYQEILTQKQESNMVDESDCSFLMNSLGIVCFAKGDFALASKFFQSCLDMRSSLTADSATVLYNLATSEEKRGHHDRAIECFEMSLAMDESSVSPEHHNSNIIMDTLQRLGRIYQLSGNLERALDCALKALERLASANDSSSLLVKAKLYNLSGNLYLQMGMAEKMMENFVKSTELFRAIGDDNSDSLIVAGFYLYGFAKLHPPCASVA